MIDNARNACYYTPNNPYTRISAKATNMPQFTVFNVKTREKRTFGSGNLTLQQALIAAYAQERGDYNTWDYAKYRKLCGYTAIQRLGDWAVSEAQDARPLYRLDEMLGFTHVKRAVEVALVGKHSITLVARGEHNPAQAFYKLVKKLNWGAVFVTTLCPCGNWSPSDFRACVCKPEDVEAHWQTRAFQEAKRAEITIEAGPYIEMSVPFHSDSDEVVKGRILAAQQRAIPMQLTPAAQTLFNQAARLMPHLVEGGDPNATTFRVARSIARLAASDVVDSVHIAEALQYRWRD